MSLLSLDKLKVLIYDSVTFIYTHSLRRESLFIFYFCMQANTVTLQLNLMENYIGNEGAKAISEMLKENCFISHLVRVFIVREIRRIIS